MLPAPLPMNERCSQVPSSRLPPSDEVSICLSASGLVAGYRESGVQLIAVDYTHPSAVNNNAKCYANHKIDFVMVRGRSHGTSCWGRRGSDEGEEVEGEPPGGGGGAYIALSTAR